MGSLGANQKDLALPKGSLLLVTGASGFIASHVVKEALDLGYRVRGTARTAEKCQRSEKVFDSPNYETAVVAHMAEEGAFDEAVKGVDAVIHTASVLSFSANPNEVIPDTIAGAVNALKAAANERSVKQFVYTSSSTAATLPKPGKKFPLLKETWNDEAVKAAWAPPPYNQERAFTVYAASKTESERAVWEWAKEHKPNLVVNTVLPNANFGGVIDSKGATGDWVPQVLKGNVQTSIPPQWMINVTDDARLHIAAVIDNTVNDERIYAFDSPFNWNDIIDAIKEVRPNAELPDHVPDQGRDLSEPDNALGAKLLEKWWGQKGYRGLVQSVRENLENEP